MKDRDLLARAYEKLILVRKCEEAIQREYFNDEMKTPVHLGIGGEAIAVGTLAVAPEPHCVFGTYRNHAIFLALSDDTDSFFGEIYGKLTGCGKGKAGSMHLSAPKHGLIATSAVVASTIPVAVGAALARRYRGNSEPVFVFFGDGATEEGVFWESLNFASLKRLNLVFVCEDNGLAIHAHAEHRHGYRDLKSVAGTFEVMRYGGGDGSDLSKVMSETSQILREMRAQPGPAVLHFTYHRFLEHVGPLEDYKFGYRQKPERLEERFDPVAKGRRALLDAGIAPEALAEVESRVVLRIEESIERAKAAPFPNPSELFTDVLANGAISGGAVTRYSH